MHRVSIMTETAKTAPVQVITESIFDVVKTAEEAHAHRIIDDAHPLHCEVCEREVGLMPNGTFVPYSIDVTTLVLCKPHLEEDVLRQVWEG